MFLQHLSVLSFLVVTLANVENNLIFDYFHYKKAPSVIGFSCNSPTDDISLISRFNRAGITVSINKLNDNYKISRFAQTNYYKLGVFLDIRCFNEQNIRLLFAEASDNKMYDELHYWLIIATSIENITNILNKAAFNLLTDFIVAVPVDGYVLNTYRLYDMYNPMKDRGAPINTTFFGSWNMVNFTVSLNELKCRRRSNLEGMTVRAAFYHSKFKPYNMPIADYFQDYSTTTKDGLSKFGFNIVTHLSEIYNFKLQAFAAAKWEVGDAVGPIIRSLNKKEIDLTGTPATMNVARTYLVKYVHQSWPFRTCFVFRSPQPKYIKYDEILAPFTWDVWYLIVATVLLCTWTLAFLFSFEHGDARIMRYSNAALVVLASFCQQGTDTTMRLSSTRIAFLHVLIFSLLVYNYYSSSFVSTRFSAPIFKINDSLSELAKTDLKIASEWMVYFELFIKRKDWETREFYTKKWLKIPDSEKFMDPETGIRLVQEGGFAYHMHPDVGYPYINQWYSNHEICELTEIHLAKPTYSTFAVGLNSSLVEIMRIGFTKIDEVGIRLRQVRRWTSRKPHCLRDVLSASSINIYEFLPVLIILLFGILVSGIICTFEIIITAQDGGSRSRTIHFLINRIMRINSAIKS